MQEHHETTDNGNDQQAVIHMHTESSILRRGEGYDESGQSDPWRQVGVSEISPSGFCGGSDSDTSILSSSFSKRKRVLTPEQKQKAKEWREKNKDRLSKQNADWRANKRLEDPDYSSRTMKEWRSRLTDEEKLAYAEDNARRCSERHYKFREENNKTSKEYYQNNKAQSNEYSKQWALDHPDLRKISVDKFNRKTRGQPDPLWPEPSACDLCGLPESSLSRSGKPKRLALDDCHSTGVFRGWLCFRCNSTLGKACDDHDLLMRMSLYLRMYSDKSE